MATRTVTSVGLVVFLAAAAMLAGAHAASEIAESPACKAMADKLCGYCGPNLGICWESCIIQHKHQLSAAGCGMAGAAVDTLGEAKADEPDAASSTAPPASHDKLEEATEDETQVDVAEPQRAGTGGNGDPEGMSTGLIAAFASVGAVVVAVGVVVVRRKRRSVAAEYSGPLLTLQKGDVEAQ